MAKILYHAVPGDWRKEQKYTFLEKSASVAGVKWTRLTPDKRGNWITNDSDEEFETFLPIGSKEAKAGTNVPTIFRTYSLGVSTNRDAVVFDFDPKTLAKRIAQFSDAYNEKVQRYEDKNRPANIDDFVRMEKVKWSETLKKQLAGGVKARFVKNKIRSAIYRPFGRMWLYFDDILIDRPGAFAEYFPSSLKTQENRLIVANLSPERRVCSFICDTIPSKDIAGGFGSPTYCFPLFAYSEDGKERRDNITPKARTLFQIFYADDRITAADIFHYVYALLHHPAYRTRFAANLKRDLPRIPFIGIGRDGVSPSQTSQKIKNGTTTRRPSQMQFFPLSAVAKMQGDAKPDHNPKASAKLFHAFAAAGKKLADLHVNYESAKEFPLKRIENKEVPLDWRVESMKLTKDKSSILYNDFLTLAGIPPEAFDYRLGNRSALEWVIDQYRVTRDEHAKTTSDPNRQDYEEYIVRLIGQVITVSLETGKLVSSLPQISFERCFGNQFTVPSDTGAPDFLIFRAGVISLCSHPCPQFIRPFEPAGSAFS